MSVISWTHALAVCDVRYRVCMVLKFNWFIYIPKVVVCQDFDWSTLNPSTFLLFWNIYLSVYLVSKIVECLFLSLGIFGFSYIHCSENLFLWCSFFNVLLAASIHVLLFFFKMSPSLWFDRQWKQRACWNLYFHLKRFQVRFIAIFSFWNTVNR